MDLFTILDCVQRRFSCLRFARNCGIALYFSLVWSRLDRKFSCLRHAQTGRKKLRSFEQRTSPFELKFEGSLTLAHPWANPGPGIALVLF